MKKFQRTIEDFVCEKCGAENKGNGYTNHCFKCLWSKHVDVNPGDRAEECGGMMCPVKIETEKGKFYIIHKCVTCGFERKKEFEKEDNFDAALEVAKK
jgi:hypothetical protein